MVLSYFSFIPDNFNGFVQGDNFQADWCCLFFVATPLEIIQKRRTFALCFLKILFLTNFQSISSMTDVLQGR